MYKNLLACFFIFNFQELLVWMVISMTEEANLEDPKLSVCVLNHLWFVMFVKLPQFFRSVLSSFENGLTKTLPNSTTILFMRHHVKSIMDNLNMRLVTECCLHILFALNFIPFTKVYYRTLFSTDNNVYYLCNFQWAHQPRHLLLKLL